MVQVTIQLHEATIREVDRYVEAANGALGRTAYTRETAIIAVVQDWARARTVTATELRWNPPIHKLL